MWPALGERATATKIVSYASRTLPPEQRRALILWAQSVRYEQIAELLELEDANSARRLVRAALQRLRRQFRRTELAVSAPGQD